MKIYGIALVKDEADVIGQSICHALTFCDRIAVLDNGSDDGTVAVIEELSRSHPGRVILWGVTREPFRRSLRGQVYDDLRRDLGWHDWIFQLDADEFLMGDPRLRLAEADADGFGSVRTWQAQFRFTTRDLEEWEAGRDDRSRPIEERRRFFSVDWRETRFFLNRPDRAWEGSENTYPDWVGPAAPFCPVNRHYQYRDPEQIQNRLDVRAAVRSERAFSHITAGSWREEVVPTHGLREWDLQSPIRPHPWRYYKRRVRQTLPI